MDEQAKAAFGSASDTSKQLITLATGLLALEITFAKDVIGSLDTFSQCLMGISWVLFLLSVITGVWTLLALTGTLAQPSAATSQSIWGMNVRVPAILQIILFLGGLIFTVWFGVRAV